MAPTSDQLERQIGETRGKLESRVVELRELGRRRAVLARQLALVAAGVGTAVGVVVVGVLVVRRLRRPPTRRERLARLLPPGTFRDLLRVRDALELRGRRRMPPVRLYVGDRRVAGEPEADGGGWERVAVSAGRAAGRAAGTAAANRLLRAVLPGSR
jgi:hypothetical protein